MLNCDLGAKVVSWGVGRWPSWAGLEGQMPLPALLPLSRSLIGKVRGRGPDPRFCQTYTESLRGFHGYLKRRPDTVAWNIGVSKNLGGQDSGVVWIGFIKSTETC